MNHMVPHESVTSLLHEPVQAEQVSRPRKVERLLPGTATRDGAGVKLTRLLTQPLQRRLDPFLLLDGFATDNPDDYIGGFPDHPHRGFETVTYMLEGFMRHRDSAGHEGLLSGGDMQWMTAGRGVIHSELPEQDHGRMEGFQVWLNLPARDKLCDPWYRDFASDEIPEFEHAGVVARVLAGTSHGVHGAVMRPTTQALILDLHFEPGARFVHALPDTHNAFVHVYRGELVIGGQPIGTGQTAIFDNMPRRDGVAMRTAAKQWARALLFAGKPLDEPIIQYGPFVMNSTDQIKAAVEDFQSGRFA